jgi:hypothetical protein
MLALGIVSFNIPAPPTPKRLPLTTFTAAEYVRERTYGEEITVVRRLLDQYHPRYVLVTSPPLVKAHRAAGQRRA